MVDDTNKCGFTGTVGSKQTEHRTLLHGDTHIVEGAEGAKIFLYMLNF